VAVGRGEARSLQRQTGHEEKGLRKARAAFWISYPTLADSSGAAAQRCQPTFECDRLGQSVVRRSFLSRTPGLLDLE